MPKLCLPAEKDQRDCTAEDLDYATMSATKRPRPLAPRSRVFAAFMAGTGNVSLILTLILTRISPVVILEKAEEAVELYLKLTDVEGSDPWRNE